VEVEAFSKVCPCGKPTSLLVLCSADLTHCQPRTPFRSLRLASEDTTATHHRGKNADLNLYTAVSVSVARVPLKFSPNPSGAKAGRTLRHLFLYRPQRLRITSHCAQDISMCPPAYLPHSVKSGLGLLRFDFASFWAQNWVKQTAPLIQVLRIRVRILSLGAPISSNPVNFYIPALSQ
jgi:hypothetical protein